MVREKIPKPSDVIQLPLNDVQLLSALWQAGYKSAEIADIGIGSKEIRVLEKIPESPNCSVPLFWKIIEDAGRLRGDGGSYYHQITEEKAQS